MSHITKGTLRVKSLDALGEAAPHFGMELRRDVTTFKWFGRYVGDSPGIKGMKPEDYGKCEHVLRLKDAQRGDYEIGVVKAKDHDGYDLHFDTWGQGRLLAAIGGESMSNIKQEYGVAVATRNVSARLARQGFVFAGRQTLPNGRVRLLVRKR
jgi:hypothetical protein